MNYATIKFNDIANGLGIRTSLFVSGCTHHCKGCFNQDTWDFNYGDPFTNQTIEDLLSYLSLSHISGLSLLGGEPLEIEHQREILPLVKKAKQQYPEKTIWCYTGYTFDKDLIPGGKVYTKDTDELLSYIDVLVDGEFMIAKKDIRLKFRGSSNQRIIDVQKSINEQTVILYKEVYNNE